MLLQTLKLLITLLCIRVNLLFHLVDNISCPDVHISTVIRFMMN